MTMQLPNTADGPDHTHFVRPERGRWMRMLLNLLLRITVKWQLGSRIDIAALRSRMEKLNKQAEPGIRRQPLHCNEVAAEWLTPDDFQPDRVLLYIHGGAFVARTPELHAAMVAPWCRALNARALMVDYRLAPEHPYPAALDDCCAVYDWLLGQGIDLEGVVIAGDSAGGNLALATLQRMRAERKPLPVGAVLLSPFLDFTLGGESVLGNAGHDPVFSLKFGIGIRNFYAAPADYANPGVSPLFGNFEGLPPTLLQVGSSEMLLDDSVRASVLANAAGVAVQLEIWERLPHVFQAIAALPQARDATRNILHFISGCTGWPIEQRSLHEK